MAFFGKIQNPVIQKESVPVRTVRKSSTASSTSTSTSSRLAVASKDSRRGISRSEPANTRTNVKSSLQPRKRRRTNLTVPSHSTPFGDDSSDDDDETDSKRSRSTSAIPKATDGDVPIDTKRRLRAQRDSSETDKIELFSLIHAEDVASVNPNKLEPALGASREDDLKVKLYYPGTSQPERYQLIKKQRDKVDSITEIMEVIKMFSDVYLTPAQAEEFTDENIGIIRKLDRACNLHKTKNTNTIQDFKSAIQLYNTKIKQYRKDGTIAKNLDRRHCLPKEFIKFFMGVIYDRAVSAQVDTLRDYENGTDYVYGELQFPLLSRIFTETSLKSDQIFLDLGSGCGNVVLQAALETGCESWGCEIMPNACKLALKQKAEFIARCRLWGIAAGKVHLEEGDFLENEATKKILKKADVILVNNHVFTPQLNDQLKMLFLDLKAGAKVVSLKSFVRYDQVGLMRNENDLGNIFSESRMGHFYAQDVSWTDEPGEYHVAVRGGPPSL